MVHASVRTHDWVKEWKSKHQLVKFWNQVERSKHQSSFVWSKVRQSKYQTHQRAGHNNNYTDLGLNLYFSLTEYEEGIKYFKQYYQESDREIALYHLLNWLINWNLPEEWLTVYEQALEEGIEPRKSLQEQYDILQNNPDKEFTDRFMHFW